MSRLAPLDKALVLIVVPLWVVCFALGVRSQAQGGGVANLGVVLEGPAAYPVLTGEFGGAIHTSDPLAPAGLRAGDRLIRMGDVDLRGVDSLGLAARSYDIGGRDLDVAMVYERDGERHTTTFSKAPLSTFRSTLLVSFAFVVSALFLLFRAPSTPTVRAQFHAALAWGFANCTFPGSENELYAWLVLWVAAALVVHALSLRFLMRFPDDRVPEGRWHAIWPWFFGIPAALFNYLLFTRWVGIGELGFFAIAVTASGAMLFVATRKYRRADRVARRQMRWALLGIYGAALPPAIAAAATAIDPRFGWLWFVSLWAAPLFPISLVVSVLRFNLFDVDRLLSATTSYNILIVLLGAGALILVPRLSEAASSLVGVDPGVGQVVLSLALAAVVVPAHRRLRPQIDRVLFRERYAVDQGVAELLPTLAHARNAGDLTERVGEGLHRLLRPEACAVYAAAAGSYTAVFAEGRAVPPAFEGDSPLVGTLRSRRAPLSLSGAGRRPDEAALSPFDRAALETLQAEVVVPVHRGDALAAFLCLGPKRSGDVYTATDLSLLTAVAETASRELQRFDQEETIREGREMQASLRRYVPGAIAEQLDGGAELVSGEREVSVLFVDIRGYTGFAESRKAEEIFSTVNRYTETVSQIVQRNSGSVVEFNGDGMMAVFGAPRELARKERAAVEAGREIVTAVCALPIEGGESLSVGVGIATGEAFVGNIQAVDRMIWSAIGNTTNLAARLQSLTRELGAAIVIDAETWSRAQAAAGGFEKRTDVPIRGRREMQDVYVLVTSGAAPRLPA